MLGDAGEQLSPILQEFDRRASAATSCCGSQVVEMASQECLTLGAGKSLAQSGAKAEQ
jgi:hypothetical protein